MRKLEAVPGQTYKQTIVHCDFCGERTVVGCAYCNVCKKDVCTNCSGHLTKLGVFDLCDECMDENLLIEYNEAENSKTEAQRAFDLTKPAFAVQVAELKAMPEMQKAVSDKDDNRINEIVKEYLDAQAGRFQERDSANKALSEAMKAVDCAMDKIKRYVQKCQALCLPKSD